MYDDTNRFLPEARLAVRVLRHVAREPMLALKGGTAINLFYRDLPRLSVDLDLAYLPLEPREQSLAAIAGALRRIAASVARELEGVRVRTQQAANGKLIAEHDRTAVTIEVNTVLRGSVFPAERRAARPAVELLFGDVDAQVLAFEDLFAGKLVAALDRQHPRDLFDVKLLLEGEGLTESLLDAFVVYLASHDRAIAEVLSPGEKDIAAVYEREFRRMTAAPISLEQLLEARRGLVRELHRRLTGRQKEFLRSVKTLEPDWSFLRVAHLKDLPALRWKLRNLERFRREQPARYAEARDDLERVLVRMG